MENLWQPLCCNSETLRVATVRPRCNFRTIVLNCGTDSLVGEMMGETAVRWPHQHLLESVALWSADVTLHLRQFQNQNGETKSVTEIRVNRLEPLA